MISNNSSPYSRSISVETLEKKYTSIEETFTRSNDPKSEVKKLDKLNSQVCSKTRKCDKRIKKLGTRAQTQDYDEKLKALTIEYLKKENDLKLQYEAKLQAVIAEFNEKKENLKTIVETFNAKCTKNQVKINACEKEREALQILSGKIQTQVSLLRKNLEIEENRVTAEKVALFRGNTKVTFNMGTQIKEILCDSKITINNLIKLARYEFGLLDNPRVFMSIGDFRLTGTCLLSTILERYNGPLTLQDYSNPIENKDSTDKVEETREVDQKKQITFYIFGRYFYYSFLSEEYEKLTVLEVKTKIANILHLDWDSEKIKKIQFFSGSALFNDDALFKDYRRCNSVSIELPQLSS